MLRSSVEAMRLVSGGVLWGALLWAPVAGAADPAQATQARRAAHLLGYVANDYGGAVRGGVVVNQSELDEQLALLREAATLLRGLPDAGQALATVEQAQKIAQAKGDAKELEPLVRGTSEALLASAGGMIPPGAPSFERGREVFARVCASCHGADGSTPTPQGALLKPPPADLLDPRLVEELSPARVALAVEFGIPGTAMVPRADLSPSERWDVAFYAAALSFPPGEGPAAGPSFALAEQAALANGEMRQALLTAGAPIGQLEGLMGRVRREIQYREGPSLGGARAALRRGQAASDEAGRREAAGQAIGQIEGALAARAHGGQRPALQAVIGRLGQARTEAELGALVDELYRLDSPLPLAPRGGQSRAAVVAALGLAALVGLLLAWRRGRAGAR